MKSRYLLPVVLLSACSSKRATFAPPGEYPSETEEDAGRGPRNPLPASGADGAASGTPANGTALPGVAATAPQGTSGVGAMTPTLDANGMPIAGPALPVTAMPGATGASAADPTLPSTTPSGVTPGETMGPAAATDCELLECCTAVDCANGRSCVNGTCLCQQGTKDCNGQCIGTSACCNDADCSSGGTCNQGTCECPQGMHSCADACVSNSAPATCGSACEPCKDPTGGSAGCDGTQCTAECGADQKPCAGACIDKTAACDSVCDATSHDCNGICAANDSVTACGTQCSPCSVPTHGSATCDGKSCGIECNDTYKICGDECIQETACCDAGDCGSGMHCDEHVCSCADGQKACGMLCIDSSGCCDDQECASGSSCLDHECVDKTAPHIVSTVPASDALGVLEDAKLKITFSERMDQASVKNALVISGADAADLSLSWDNAGTTVTITSSKPWQINTVQDVANAPRKYTVSIGTDAKDSAGNEIAASSFNFFTIRELQLGLGPTMIAGVNSTTLSSMAPSSCGNNDAPVGTFSSPSTGSYTLFASYDANKLIQPSQITDFESATFRFVETDPSANFFPGGTVKVERVAYGAIDSNVLGLSPDHTVGTVSDPPAQFGSVYQFDISDWFWSDWSSGKSKMLFRLSPGTGATNEYAYFTCNTFYIQVSFRAP
ncbi:MAG TPA: Ig-like domain-containing protein [Polyangiaceae bacterium]|nr:Ig-like domain-containing protein [Polyangiaceae bacterium]